MPDFFCCAGKDLCDAIKSALNPPVHGNIADKILYYMVLSGAIAMFIISLVGVFKETEVTKIEDALSTSVSAPEQVTMCISQAALGGFVTSLEGEAGTVDLKTQGFEFSTMDGRMMYVEEGANNSQPFFSQFFYSAASEKADIKPTGMEVFNSDRFNFLTPKFELTNTMCVSVNISGSFKSKEDTMLFGLVFTNGVEFFSTNESSPSLSLPLTLDLEIKLKGAEFPKELSIPMSQVSYGTVLQLDIQEEITDKKGKVSRDYITSGLRLDARPVNISRTTQFGNVECNIRTINCQFAVVISPQTMVVKKITIKDITAGEYIALVGGAWSAALLIVTIVFTTVTPKAAGPPDEQIYLARFRREPTQKPEQSDTQKQAPDSINLM